MTLSSAVNISDALEHCASEPIHIPGSIQPHGVLLSLSVPGLELLQASANFSELAGKPVEQLLGKPLSTALTSLPFSVIERALGEAVFGEYPLFLCTTALDTAEGPKRYDVTAHLSDSALIVELEERHQEEAAVPPSLQVLLQHFIFSLQNAHSIYDLSLLAVKEVARITGFGRVLIYQFDEEWNGRVIAEERTDEMLPSYLDLRFPASDIPAQARTLYLRNRLRLIADADYRPVPLQPAFNPLTGKPLDLTYATLRSVSPVHIEYMKNMETASSMSVSIIVNGALWGLISCHDRSPRTLPFQTRSACDFIGQFLSLQLSAKQHRMDYEYRLSLKGIYASLLAAMTAAKDFSKALEYQQLDLLRLAGAEGAAVVFGGKIILLGQTPAEADVRQLADWLSGHNDDLYHTTALSRDFPKAEAYSGVASGLVAISISQLNQGFVMWFRPEMLRTVTWAGQPGKAVEPSGDGMRLSPRKSFEAWSETVRRHATPWREEELQAAAELRNAIIGIVLRQAEEMAALNAELERSNSELEAFSYTVSHDLRAPFRHIVGYAELLKESEGGKLTETGLRFLNNIQESGIFAGDLVDNLLNFSKVGRLPLDPVLVRTDILVDEVIADLHSEIGERKVTWKKMPLPDVQGDLMLMRLVWCNLLANAVKYTRQREEAVIEINCEKSLNDYIFKISDNGVGFEMQYIDKLFGVFQRLHRMEDFEGTGIGLANVRRIVARHGGQTWAEGAPDKGASFYFSLPR